jgi:type II secretory pathway component PulK
MNRRGSALLTVLWLTVLLAAMGGAAMGAARTGTTLTANRMTLARGRWATEGCLGLAMARYASKGRMEPVPPTALGEGIWCEAAVEDPGAAIDLNHADRVLLRRVLGRDDLTDALLDWRDADTLPHPLGAEQGWYRARGRDLPRNGPLASVAELGLVRGFEDSVLARVRPPLTTRGDGTVSITTAPAEVLSALPGFGPEAVETVLHLRERGTPLSLEQLYYAVSPAARSALGAVYQDLSQLTVSASPRLVLRITGGVGSAMPVHRLTVTVAPAGARLAVLRREVE